MTDQCSPTVAQIERDLLSRFTQAGPRDRKLIASVAAVAAEVLQIDASAHAGGINAAWARHLAARTTTLLRGLYMLGSERVADTQAERILARATRTADTLGTMQTTAGSA